MEKGFKDRLKKEGLTYPTSGSQGHDLSVLYQLTHQINQGTWAQSLAESYNDAVTFYEYDIQALPHLATLDTYLNKVGSNQMFTQMRLCTKSRISHRLLVQVPHFWFKWYFWSKWV